MILFRIQVENSYMQIACDGQFYNFRRIFLCPVSAGKIFLIPFKYFSCVMESARLLILQGELEIF
jgi:hypothetical protein